MVDQALPSHVPSQEAGQGVLLLVPLSAVQKD